jgi:hypothetical protein
MTALKEAIGQRTAQEQSQRDAADFYHYVRGMNTHAHQKNIDPKSHSCSQHFDTLIMLGYRVFFLKKSLNDCQKAVRRRAGVCLRDSVNRLFDGEAFHFQQAGMRDLRPKHW